MLRTLVVNTGSNVSVMVVKLAITFVMTPILVRNLGNYNYGLWEMVGAIIGYAGMLDLGIRPAVSRYAAKFHAEDDHARMLQVYSSSMAFMFCVGSVLMVFCTIFALFFPSVLAPEGAAVGIYTLFLIILGVQLLFSFPGFVAESYLEGLQKYYLKNNITIFNSIVGSCFIYLYITESNALWLLVAVNTTGLSIKYCLFGAILAQKKNGGLKPTRSAFSFMQLKDLLSFGGKSFVQGVATRLDNATDSLVIGFTLGPALVPFYSVPANLVNYLRTLGWTLSHAFMPLFSRLDAMAEFDRTREIYLTASKFVVGLLMPLSVGVLVVGAPFLTLWIGPEYGEKGQWVLIYLVAFCMVPLLNPFASRYLTAINKHGIFAKLMPVGAIANLVLSVILVHFYGIEGVAFASLIPTVVLVPIYLRFVCFNLGISMLHYVRRCLLPVILPTAFLAAAAVAIRLATGLNSYGDIVVTAVGGGIVWLPCFWFMALSRQDRASFLRVFRSKVAGG